MRTPPRSVPVVIRLAGPAGRMTTGASPLTTTGNGSSSYFGFKLCACVPLRSQHLPCDALIEFVLRHRMGLRFGLVHGGIEHLPERGRSGGHQARRRCRSPRWGKRVFLKSECPQREMNRSSDVRQVQWPEWVDCRHQTTKAQWPLPNHKRPARPVTAEAERQRPDLTESSRSDSSGHWQQSTHSRPPARRKADVQRRANRRRFSAVQRPKGARLSAGLAVGWKSLTGPLFPTIGSANK